VIGESASLTKNGTIEFTLSVEEVIRGSGALDVIMQANQFNDPAPEGFEWVLARIQINYTGEDQGMLEISKQNFAVVTNGRIIHYDDTFIYSPCCIEPDLELSLMPGGTGSGWISVPVVIDDQSPLLAIGLRDNGTGGIFFSLTQ
jgi:hypothetical protein